MKTFLRIILALVVIGIVALAAIIFVPPVLTKPDSTIAADWKPKRFAMPCWLFRGCSITKCMAPAFLLWKMASDKSCWE